MKIKAMLVYEPENGVECFRIKCKQCKCKIEGTPCKIQEFFTYDEDQ